MKFKKFISNATFIENQSVNTLTLDFFQTSTNLLNQTLLLAPPIKSNYQVAGELLLQFSAGMNAEGRAKALAAVGGSVIEELWNDNTESNGFRLVRVTISPDLPTDKAIEILLRQPGIKFAEANYIVTSQATSNDPQYTNGSLWGMHGDASGSTYGTAADEAWAAGITGNSKTVVGIIDTGIDYRHLDLYLNVWLNQSEIPTAIKNLLKDVDSDGLITFRDLNNSANSLYVKDVNLNKYIDAGDLLNDVRWEDGVDTDINGYRDDLVGWDFVNSDNDPFDDNSHGTHVAGTIGGLGGNSAGVVGVNWSTQMMGLKFLSSTGSGTTSNALKALDYYTAMSNVAPAASNFVGTNNSWGGGGFSQSMLDAIVRTGTAGNFFVAAAGNGGSDGIGDNNDSVANYPSNYNTLSTVGWDAVVAVAALTSTGSLASFSNYGNSTVDLAAPGYSILSTIPNGGYGTKSGTSMATPHVMGALSLIASAMPNATPQEWLNTLRYCITYKADLANALAWDGWLDLGKLQSSLTQISSNPFVSSIVFSDTSLKIGDSSSVTVTFSEAVTGFSISDIVFSSTVGSLGNFTTSDNKIWIATFSPSAGIEAQGVTLSVLSNSYTSLDGTRLGQAFTSSPIALDTKAPAVSITLSDTQLVAGDTALVTFTFSEAVSGFTNSDINLSNANGSLSGFTQVNTSLWQAIFTPTADLNSATNSLSVISSSYTDVGGNTGLGSTSTNYAINTTGSISSVIYGTDGSDRLAGTTANETLNGVPQISSLLGRGSIDTLTGGGGSDTFVLGLTSKIFYNDGRSNNLGSTDYASITDFVSGVDKLQLAAGVSYVYSMASVNGATGLAVLWDTNMNGTVDSKSDEMIGFLAGIRTISSSDIVLI